MIKNIILALMLNCIVAFASAQNKVSIAGTIDTSLTNFFKSNELTFVRQNKISRSEEIGKALINQNGTFKINLNLKDTLEYITINLQNNRPKDAFSGKLVNVSFPRKDRMPEMYLFEQGDSILMRIRNGKPIIFSGKGSEKMNCQAQIYSIPLIPFGADLRSSELTNLLEPLNKLAFDEEIIHLSTKMRLGILESFKNKISVPIIKRLSLDVIASAESTLLCNAAYFNMVFEKKEQMPMRSVTHKFFMEYYNGHKGLHIDSTYIISSGFYTDYLLTKELLNFSFFQGDLRYKLPDFGSIYNSIISKYKGNLRATLLIGLFDKMGIESLEESKKFTSNALHYLSDEQDRKYLMEWLDQQSAAFPFKLYDVNNRVHNLSDYKDKVVIIETWFTGCSACIALSKAMRPILDKYKTNKEVVFITIGTDSEEKWLKSVEGGNYTHPETINLHTNGLGWKDPMFKFYGWEGSPNQLIIGKKGNLINAAPPRVDDGLENVTLFQAIIDKALNAK